MRDRKYEVFFNGDKIAELYSPVYLEAFLVPAVLEDGSLHELKVKVSKIREVKK